MKSILLNSILTAFICLSISISNAQEGDQIKLTDPMHQITKGSKLTLKKDVIINKGSDKVLLGRYCATCSKDRRLCQNKKHPTLTFILVVANRDDTKHRKIKKGRVFTIEDYTRPQLKIMDDPKSRYIQITNKDGVDLLIKHLTLVFDVEIAVIETDDF